MRLFLLTLTLAAALPAQPVPASLFDALSWRLIGRFLVHPTNPDIVFVAALGHAWGPNPERGVFRSTDGGRNWSKVLYKGPDTGAVDLAWAPEDPQTIYAALWNVRRPARIQ